MQLIYYQFLCLYDKTETESSLLQVLNIKRLIITQGQQPAFTSIEGVVIHSKQNINLIGECNPT